MGEELLYLIDRSKPNTFKRDKEKILAIIRKNPELITYSAQSPSYHINMGDSLLMVALKNEQVGYEIIQFLLDQIKDKKTLENLINQVNSLNVSPLLYILSLNSPTKEIYELIKLFIDNNADLTIKNKEGLTPLQYALHYNTKEIYHLLLSQDNVKSIINIPDENGITPLMFGMCIEDDNPQLTQALIEKGSDLTAQDNEGHTVLHYALKSGNIEIVKLILSQNNIKSILDVPDHNGITPSLMAVDRALNRHHIEFVQLLAEKGANFNIQMKTGLTPLYWAVDNEDQALTELLLSLDNYKEFIETQNSDGNTPLMNAFLRGNVELAELLIKKGANIKIQDKEGNSLINIAVSLNNDKLLQLLLEHKDANQMIDAPDNNGSTPLIYAVSNRKNSIARLLLKHGANPIYPAYTELKLIDVMRSNYNFDLIKDIEESEEIFKKEHPTIYNELNNAYQLMSEVRYDFGHTLGLRTEFSVPSLNNQEERVFATEGGNSQIAISKLIGMLDGYLKKGLKQPSHMAENQAKTEDDHIFNDFTEINEAFKQGIEYPKYGTTKSLEDILERLKNQPPKPTFIPSGWHMHAISIVIHGELLIVTNRGEGMNSTGTTVYKLKDNVQFEIDTIKSLLETKDATMVETKSRINDLIDPDYIGIPLGSTAQVGGSCSMSNPKSSMEAMLFSNKFYRLSKEKRVAIFESMKITTFDMDRDFGEKEAQQLALEKIEYSESIQELTEYAEMKYKRATKFFRDQSISKLVTKLKEANENKNFSYSRLYKTLIAEYLLEHHGKEKKKKQRGEIAKPISEFERLEKILQLLDTKEIEEIEELIQSLKSNRPVYFSQYDLEKRDIVHALKKGLFKAIQFFNVDITEEPYISTLGDMINAAIKNGDVNTLNLITNTFPNLIAAIIKYTSEYENIKHPLLTSLEEDQHDIFKFLLKQGASLSDKDKYGTTVLSYAAIVKRIESFGLLDLPEAQGVINTKNVRGATPLRFSLGNMHLAERLIEMGAKLEDIIVEDLHSFDKASLLVLCIIHNKQDIITQLLKDKHAGEFLYFNFDNANTGIRQSIFNFALKEIKDPVNLKLLHEVKRSFSPYYQLDIKMSKLKDSHKITSESPSSGPQKKKQ